VSEPLTAPAGELASMLLSDDDVLARCDELRRFVLEDLERMVQMPVGDNFAAARSEGGLVEDLGGAT
jgi:hypothetical protein